MFYCIYTKNKPKDKWHLFSIALSAEEISNNITKALQQAQSEGYEQAEAAFQLFETAEYIPHYLNQIKEQKIIYN
jgi:hypothetical protein